MDLAHSCPLAVELATRLREAKEELTRRWLERVVARVSIDPHRVFPTDELLDHIPILLLGIADSIEHPADEISADMPVVAKAMELGALRHAQGFSVHEILKEYEIMGGVLFTFLTGTVDQIERRCTRGELLACAHRLFHAIAIVQQATTDHYVRVTSERVRERENRLRSFNRMVSHELRDRIGAILSAGRLLEEPSVAREQRERFVAIITANAHDTQAILENLIKLSRLDAEVRLQRDVPLSRAAAEAVRQLRELAREREVEVRISESLPDVRVNAAAVELCITNYLTNAIKYSDPRKPDRWAEIGGYIRGDLEGAGPQLVVEVRDNGVGVPEAKRARLFERFYRAHEGTVTGAEGTGLGLSIVRDTVEGMGGKAWAEFTEEGSIFSFSLPLERGGGASPEATHEDHAAA